MMTPFLLADLALLRRHCSPGWGISRPRYRVLNSGTRLTLGPLFHPKLRAVGRWKVEVPMDRQVIWLRWGGLLPCQMRHFLGLCRGFSIRYCLVNPIKKKKKKKFLFLITSD